MRGVKHTSKRQEDELLEKSRALAANPGILRPQCNGNCRKCAFDKPFKQIDGLAKIKDNPDALVKEASRLGGDDIVRAYAGTVSLAASGSVPMLGTAKIAGETVSFASRGTVNATKLIGCQYYDDPKLRLLLYQEPVKKNKLHLYSFGDTIVCSDDPRMPEDYLYDAFWETPYEFPDDGLDCGHETSAVLEIHVKSLGETIRICENCAKSVSTLSFVVSRIAAFDPMDDIEVRIRHKYHAAGESDAEPIEGDRLKDYAYGKVTDDIVISAAKRASLGKLKDSGAATYVVGTTNYGSDLDAFADSLEGDAREIATVRKFLSENPRPVVVKTRRCSEVLTYLWPTDWKGIVVAHTDERTAEALGDVSRGQPGAVLADAYNRYVSADVVASLPEFKRPGPMTQLADKMAKAAKVGGAQMAIDTASKTSLKDNKSRSVAAAFILAAGGDPPIKLSKEEREMADYLTMFAKGVINAGGDKYRDAMNTLLTACGAREKVS